MRYSTQILTLVTIYLFVGTSCNGEEPGGLEVHSAQELIEYVDTLVIIGSEESPVYTYSNPMLLNDELFFADHTTNKISKYDVSNGEQKGKFGGRGSGPGSMDRPTGMNSTTDGHIIIYEGGNHRFQTFDNEGNSIKVSSTEGLVFDFTVSESNSHLVWGAYSSSIDESMANVVHEIDINKDKVVRSFGEYERGDIVSESWTITNNDETIIFANNLKDHINIFDKDSDSLNQVDVTNKNTNIFPYTDEPTSPSELEDQLDKLNNAKYTRIHDIFVIDEVVYVIHERNNYEQSYFNFFIDLYDIDGGEYIKTIDGFDRKIMFIEEESLFAEYEISESEYGKVEIKFFEL